MRRVSVKTQQVLTVMMIDVKSSSQLWVSDPKWMASALDRLFGLIKTVARQERGLLVKCIGDAFMLTFKEPEDAIRMAVRLQGSLVGRRSRIGLRIGIAHGPMFVRDWEVQRCRLLDFFGNTVNTAARVESNVSSVGGFAIALCTSVPMSVPMSVSSDVRARVVTALTKKPIGLLSKKATLPDIVHFSASVDSCSAGLRRSSRLVPYSLQHGQHRVCRSVSDLHGVSPVEVFVVKSV